MNAMSRSARLITIVTAALAAATLAAWAAWALANRPPIDFGVYYLSAKLFAAGRSPYTIARSAWFAYGHHVGLHDVAWPYRYPPYTAALLQPFLPLGLHGVVWTWQLASVAAMVGAAWLLGKAIGGARGIIAALLLLVAFTPVYDTLLFGQINGFVLLSLAVALWALRTKRSSALGVSLALGTALKLVPGVLILYLAARRRWRAVLVFALTLIVLTALALPFVGLRGFVDYAHHAVDLTRPELVMNGPTNVTFVGAMGRWLTTDTTLARAIGRGLALALTMATVALCWRRPSGSRRVAAGDEPAALELALIVAALPLLPPFTWYHQLTLSLFPLLVVGRRLWQRRAVWSLTILGALLVACDIEWLLWTFVAAYGHYVPPMLYRVSFPTLLCVALWMLGGREVWLVKSAARERHAERLLDRTEAAEGWRGDTAELR
jgi:hypothetical protein